MFDMYLTSTESTKKHEVHEERTSIYIFVYFVTFVPSRCCAEKSLFAE